MTTGDRLLYHRWRAMLGRCTNPLNKDYSDYGGRGIGVCFEWREFSNFLAWAKTNGYRRELCLDRKENNHGYYPENCRWITQKENCNNRRGNLLLTAFKETKTLAEWIDDRRCVVSYNCLKSRFVHESISPEAMLSTPSGESEDHKIMVRALGENKSLREWQRDSRCRVTRKTLKKRIAAGWSAKKAILTRSRNRKEHAHSR